MDFGLSGEQELLQETVRGFLSHECPVTKLRETFDGNTGHDAPLWSGLLEMGLGGIAIPEAYGGAGMEALDLALVCEVLGESAAPGPFMGHALAGLAVVYGGSEEQKAKWLPRLASGETLGSVALGEDGDRWQPEEWTAKASGGSVRDEKVFVPSGSLAEVIIVGVAGGGLVLVESHAPGVKIESMDGIDRTRRFDRLTLDASPCQALPGGAEAAGRLRDAALVMLAADSFGAAWKLIRMTIEYAGQREQFNAPLVQFQAVKHQIANMATDIEQARGLYWYAAHALDHLRADSAHAAAVAKAHITDRAMETARSSFELHGGIGFTWECDVQIWFKRCMFNRAFLGSPEVHRERSASFAGGRPMNLKYGEEYVQFRAELREFLKGWPLSGDEAKLPLEAQQKLFRGRGIERGYVYREFPQIYGGSERAADVLTDRIINEEYLASGAPGAVGNQGSAMLAPTLLEVGNEEQRQRFIPPTLSGEMVWCQGYSEPGAGSDLASLQSRAELVGDEWVINGHKIWTTSAQDADYMFGLFRTEPAASKHAGISYLLIDMKSPGIEVRPLMEMTGAEMFNEVFFEDVRIPADNIVGKRGEGWQISRVTLKHERNLIGDPNAQRKMFQNLVQRAKNTTRHGRPAIEDRNVRQALARIEGYTMSLEFSGSRMLTATARNDLASVMLPMLTMKLYATDLRQQVTKLALDLIGSDALIAPTEEQADYSSADEPGVWSAMYMGAIAIAIAGGASNIQRNIIGERGLGLPRDVRFEKK